MPNGRPPLRKQVVSPPPLRKKKEIQNAYEACKNAVDVALISATFARIAISTMDDTLEFYEKTRIIKSFSDMKEVDTRLSTIEQRGRIARTKYYGFKIYKDKFARMKLRKKYKRQKNQNQNWVKCFLCLQNGVKPQFCTKIRQATFQLGHAHSTTCRCQRLCIGCYIGVLQSSNRNDTDHAPRGPVERTSTGRLIQDFDGSPSSPTYGSFYRWVVQQPEIQCPHCGIRHKICRDLEEKMKQTNLRQMNFRFPKWNESNHPQWTRFARDFYCWYRNPNRRKQCTRSFHDVTSI